MMRLSGYTRPPIEHFYAELFCCSPHEKAIYCKAVSFYSHKRRKICYAISKENPGVSCYARDPGGAVLFCRLGFFFLAYASRSLRFRTKAAARIVTGRAMIHIVTPVSPVAGVLLPPV